MSSACTKTKFCKPLDDRLNPLANHGKGLTAILVFNMRTGGSRLVGVMYKTKESDRGLVVHYCPWCGTNLYKLFEVDKAKKAIEIDPPRESSSTKMKKFRAEQSFKNTFVKKAKTFLLNEKHTTHITKAQARRERRAARKVI